MTTEAWQRGPVPGFDPVLMPVAHSLLQVKEDVDAVLGKLPESLLWEQPGGAASVGFHLRHLAGSSLRLATYARGEALSPDQIAEARREAVDQPSAAQVRDEVHAAVDRVLEQVRLVPNATLFDARKVGRAGLPSTTIGLLFHIAEHATRHVGQAMTTAKILMGRNGAAPV